MTVGEIIKAVRWCIDEEAMNGSSLAYDLIPVGNDCTMMDNIIKAKAGDALRWICLYGTAETLSGSDETGADAISVLVDMDNQTPTSITGTSAGYITLPSDYLKLGRVRATGWHRAIRQPIMEDSEEYLQLYDENGATATDDRPQAVLIQKASMRLELWPCNGTADYTYIKDPGRSISESSSDDTKFAIPPAAKSSFIYYLAFLLLSAYGDARAPRMLEIAKLNMGIGG